MRNRVLIPEFRGYPEQGNLRKFTLHQAHGKHSLGYLDYEADVRLMPYFPAENTPARVQWGESPMGVRTFYGYLNHYETVTDGDSGKLRHRFVLLGTSKTMNNSVGGNWAGFTRSGIARQIARRHRLRSVVHRHPSPVETWAVGVRTDFRALRDLADEIGYRTWVDGSTLWFIDPAKSLSSPEDLSTPRFSDGDVLSSEVVGGQNAPRDGEPPHRRVVHGLDYRTNELFTSAHGDRSLPTQLLDTPVTSYSEATLRTGAISKRSTDYYTSRLVVRGNAAVTPGSLTRIDSADPERSGLWLVNEAKHVISDDGFVTQFTASRGRNRRPSIRATTSLRDTAPITSAVVRDGKTWEATLQEHVDV